jgi:hypothetical protein
LPWFAELNRSLNDTLDDAQFRARIRASVAQLNTLAAEMLTRACADYPALDGAELRALLTPAATTSTLLAEFA